MKTLKEKIEEAAEKHANSQCTRRNKADIQSIIWEWHRDDYIAGAEFGMELKDYMDAITNEDVEKIENKSRAQGYEIVGGKKARSVLEKVRAK